MNICIEKYFKEREQRRIKGKSEYVVASGADVNKLIWICFLFGMLSGIAIGVLI